MLRSDRVRINAPGVRRRRREIPLLKEPRLELVRREVDRLIDGVSD